MTAGAGRAISCHRAFDALMSGLDKIEVRSMKVRSQTAAATVLPDLANAAVHAAITKPPDE